MRRLVFAGLLVGLVGVATAAAFGQPGAPPGAAQPQEKVKEKGDKDKEKPKDKEKDKDKDKEKPKDKDKKPDDKGATTGWIKLFNGTDLAGWMPFVDPNKKVDPAQVWSVKDGVIICQGQPFGYLL